MSVYSHHDKELMGQILRNQIMIMEYLKVDALSSISPAKSDKIYDEFEKGIEETNELLK